MSVTYRQAEVRGATPDTVAAVGGGADHLVVGGQVGAVIIEGTDQAGWTLDDYVIPRLASGLYGCREVTP